MLNLGKTSAVFIGIIFLLGNAIAQDLPDKNDTERGWQAKGLKLGLNMVNLTRETGIQTAARWKMGLGPSLSGYLTYQFSPKFAFQPEVILSQRGYHRGTEMEMFSQSMSFSASALPDYINLNPFMAFSLGERLQVFTGPTFGTKLDGSFGQAGEHEGDYDEEWEDEFEDDFEDEFEDNLEEEHEDGDIDDEHGDNDVSRMDVGMVFGTEYNLGRLSFSARYNLGLSMINDPTFGVKNHVLQVMLWYRF